MTLPSRNISKNESLSIERLKITGLLSVALEELEPYDGKLSRTVLRGACCSNAARLLDRTLGGPGLLESIYEAALCHELSFQGLKIQSQVPIEVRYKGIKIRDSLILDILVENRIIIEVKATEKENPIHEVQLLTYLRLTNLRLGLLINFGRKQVKEGIKRVING
jgi:GxxExxY protein